MRYLLYILTLSTFLFGTVTDIDGNVYETVLIGNQLWMSENLKTTHYNNGDEIDTGLNDETWTSTTEGAFSIYENNPEYLENYGNLYNWYAVDDERGVCPENWHVPSDNEYKELEIYLGMSLEQANLAEAWRGTNEGLKIKDNISWNGTNESGYSALPAGYRTGSPDNSDDYFNIGNYSYFWTSTQGNNLGAWDRFVYDNESQIGRGIAGFNTGWSIRCIQDPIEGCTNPYSPNYNAEASIDDGSCLSATLNVPADFETIQEAIDYSSNGDIVFVASGTYYENINFIKNISIIGENKETTIIDGNQNGRVISYDNPQNSDVASSIENFTIKNGQWDGSGAGIYCYDGTLNLSNLIIKNNITMDGGGGIMIDNSNSLIENVEIINNSAFHRGGGIYITANSNAIINDTFISFNSSSTNGGGIAVKENSLVDITNANISKNYTENTGGGIYSVDSEVNLNQVSITGNYSDNNTAGIYVHNGDLVLNKCTIARNGTNVNYDNTGILTLSQSDTNIINSIIYSNDSGIFPIYSSSSSVIVSYSDIEYGFEGIGNIDIYPDFVELDDTGILGEGQGDYTLQSSSPCIDAGDPNSDLDPDGTRADMGAYYFHQFNLGDATLNGSIDVGDIVLVVEYILGASELSDIQFQLGDLNDSGHINVTDVILLVELILSN